MLYKLDTEERERKAWQITRGKRSRDQRMLWDIRRRCQRKTGFLAMPVFDREYEQLL